MAPTARGTFPVRDRDDPAARGRAGGGRLCPNCEGNPSDVRIVITGATGNVGSSLVERLVDDPKITSIVGIARRRPAVRWPKATWVAADVSRTDLTELFRGADAVVHLAWVIQPSHRQDLLARINVEGSRRVFQTVARAGIPALVYASSVGAYSPGPKDPPVNEAWPVEGVPSSFYSRHKAAVERLLDGFQRAHPDIRVVRLRPALIFKRQAASEVRRLFAGPFLPGFMFRRSLIPLIPNVDRLVFQVLHTSDAAEAYRLAITGDVRGAFNVAAEPVLDPPTLGRILHARPLRVPRPLVRAAVAASWRLHLQPTPPGWVDLGLESPVMDVGRAHRELGWTPRWTSGEALLDLLAGIRDGAGLDTPPLSPSTGGPLRIRELLTGVGARS
jgi:UDP-glucose 4-epimerase